MRPNCSDRLTCGFSSEYLVRSLLSRLLAQKIRVIWAKLRLRTLVYIKVRFRARYVNKRLSCKMIIMVFVVEHKALLYCCMIHNTSIDLCTLVLYSPDATKINHPIAERLTNIQDTRGPEYTKTQIKNINNRKKCRNRFTDSTSECAPRAAGALTATEPEPSSSPSQHRHWWRR